MSAIEDARAYLAPWGEAHPSDPRSVQIVRALIAEHERLTADLAARDADDVRRSEEGRTDWDYGQRIAAASCPMSVHHHLMRTCGTCDYRKPAPPTDDPIPRYAQLDVWMALFGSRVSQEYEEFRDEHGYADTWSWLLQQVRDLTAPPTDDEREALGAAAAYSHQGHFLRDDEHVDTALRG